MKLSTLNRFRDFLANELVEKLKAAVEAEKEYEEAGKEHGLLKMPTEIIERYKMAKEELEKVAAEIKEFENTDFR